MIGHNSHSLLLLAHCDWLIVTSDLKIKVPLKERCPLCRSFLTLRNRAKVDKSIDIDEVSQAEYAHNEFWLNQVNQRNFCRTMDSLVEDYMDEDEDLEGEYDSEDILFS